MWPGVQPSQDAFSEAYIKKLKYLVDAAAKRGIYTLLDMHQDVLSENFCGEGIIYFILLYYRGLYGFAAYPLIFSCVMT